MRLAPLDPDRFLRWAWSIGPRDRGTEPLTLDDVWFEMVAHQPSLTLADVRRQYVHLAAMVRRNQRCGRPALEGMER